MQLRQERSDVCDAAVTVKSSDQHHTDHDAGVVLVLCRISRTGPMSNTQTFSFIQLKLSFQKQTPLVCIDKMV